MLKPDLLDAYLYLRKYSDDTGLPAEYQRLNKPIQAVLKGGVGMLD